MPGKIAAVMQQACKLNFLVNLAVNDKMTRGFHPLAGHALAAEYQVIDIGVGRKVGARFRAWPGGIFQYVAQRLANQQSAAAPPKWSSLQRAVS
jgi:hypothetical protein